MNNTTKTLMAITLSVGLINTASAQFQNYVNDAKNAVNNYTKGSGATLSKTEISDGLKQALQVGSKNATGKVSMPNGFFGDALIKILMPPEAQKVETELRAIGMGAQVDKAILSMNRGAEEASKKALPIFINAITTITIDDGINILRGNKDAATQYLKNRTSTALYQAFLPVIRTALDQVGATKYWAEVFRIYDEIPFVDKVNTDLPAYVTQRALAGVFVYVAQEEAKIRVNPAARVTDLLKKVFGN